MHKVNDVASLLHVVDVLYHILLVVLIKLLDKVNGIAGIHLLESAGDGLVRHYLEQIGTLVLVELGKHVGCRLLVEQ